MEDVTHINRSPIIFTSKIRNAGKKLIIIRTVASCDIYFHLPGFFSFFFFFFANKGFHPFFFASHPTEKLRFGEKRTRLAARSPIGRTLYAVTSGVRNTRA